MEFEMLKKSTNPVADLAEADNQKSLHKCAKSLIFFFFLQLETYFAWMQWRTKLKSKIVSILFNHAGSWPIRYLISLEHLANQLT